MKGRWKRAVDVLMTIALLFLMGYQFWGEKMHEWAGAGLFALFAAHHILNGNWHKNLCRGRYSPVRIFQVCVDMLALLSMFALMYSGIVLSRHVFTFLPIESGLALARRLHILGSYWGFVLMSLHLGLHWNMVLGLFQRKSKAVSRSLRWPGFIEHKDVWRSLASVVLGSAAAFYGAWVFVKRNFFTYLFLRSEFVFLDYEESKIPYYMDYLCLMGLFIFISHYTCKLLRILKKKEDGL